MSGALRVRVAAASEGTLLAEITRLLDNALQARSRYVQLADRASRLYAPVVHATALLTMLGWVAVRRELARRHRHRDRGSHHHLSLCARACDPGGADRGVRRDVPRRRAAQFRRCHRAARRCRPRRLRQDGHADAARTRRRQRRRHSAGRVRARRPAGAGQPSSGRRRGGAGGRGEGRRWPARRGGARAGRARLRRRPGSQAWHGRRSAAPTRWPTRSWAAIRKSPSSPSVTARQRHVFAVRQRLRPDAAGAIAALQGAASRSKFCRATASRRCAHAARVARRSRMARRRHAGRQDRAHRGTEAAGRQGDDGRRRHERRAVAGGGARLDVADQRHPSQPGDRRSGFPRRAAWRPWWPRSTFRARRCG